MLLLQAVLTRPCYFHEQNLHLVKGTFLLLETQDPLEKALGLKLGQDSLRGFLREMRTSLVEVSRLGETAGGGVMTGGEVDMVGGVERHLLVALLVVMMLGLEQWRLLRDLALGLA
ncbi:hypothetical protein OIU85_026439 [Salix viminalis]|uniref:Uncharacterized protein n=1 Tax=Salix viminalis TaxID=40686 RepID=A0A9Q0TNJ6_SALVM|nr:hypothetical protein OIU85_026439 [Salix viminalis]